MKILVQKFGGSSLSSVKEREDAIRHVGLALKEGYHICVVVSAMGRKGQPYATDTLIQLIKENGYALEKREWDILLHCGEVISATIFSSTLNKQGIPSVVLTGGQAGIITNNDFGNAQIETINPERILHEFEQNKVVVVTGFQGKTLDGEITTLGRGGSDTSATALGAALQAEIVDIFTDVNGVMTADPRIVEDAQPLDAVTYTEIANMAYQGAKVIHPRAVEIAMQANIPIRVRSTFTTDAGTLVSTPNGIHQVGRLISDRLITGIAHISNLTQIKVFAKDGEFDLQMRVFKAMAENGISIDFINVNPIGVAYTIRDEVAGRAIAVLQEMGYEPMITPHCAKVSVIGAGMAGVPGVMAHIAEALTTQDIRIMQSADSHTTIWVLVKDEDMVTAVRALHRKFNLHMIHQ